MSVDSDLEPGGKLPISVNWEVPFWGVLGMVAQGVILAVFLLTLAGNMKESEQRVEKLEGRVTILEANAATMARMDERTLQMQKSLERMEASHR